VCVCVCVYGERILDKEKFIKILVNLIYWQMVINQDMWYEFWVKNTETTEKIYSTKVLSIVEM
jgi:hypothetical protein